MGSATLIGAAAHHSVHNTNVQDNAIRIQWIEECSKKSVGYQGREGFKELPYTEKYIECSKAFDFVN